MCAMQTPLANALSILGREALGIVLPAWCVVCQRLLPWRDRTASCCRDCWTALPKITSPKCTSCALPLVEDALCIDCLVDPLPLDWCEAWGHYLGGLERLLHAFKFERHDFFDAPLAELLEGNLRDLDFDAIVPVPMSRPRERKRGYNQAELLARALASRIGVRCELLLTARGGRKTQSKLTRPQRAANVRGAFTVSARSKGKSVLIVDDVCTTGETLRACAAALRTGGASRVCAIAVAKAS
jgi:ComF family protein